MAMGKGVPAALDFTECAQLAPGVSDGASSSFHLCDSVITPKVLLSRSSANKHALQYLKEEEKHGLAQCLWGLTLWAGPGVPWAVTGARGAPVTPVLESHPVRAAMTGFLRSCGVLTQTPSLENLGNEFGRKERRILYEPCRKTMCRAE